MIPKFFSFHLLEFLTPLLEYLIFNELCTFSYSFQNHTCSTDSFTTSEYLSQSNDIVINVILLYFTLALIFSSFPLCIDRLDGTVVL